MKKYLTIIFNMLFILFLVACNLSKSSSSKSNLIGIQRKTNNGFTYNIKNYDFNNDLKFEIISIFKEQNGTETELGAMFAITESDWNVSSNKINIKLIKKGAPLAFAEFEFDKFKEAVSNGGTFRAINLFDTKKMDSRNTGNNTKIIKEKNENNYVFLDIKIKTGELDSKKQPKKEEVSFAINIEKLNEKIKNPKIIIKNNLNYKQN